jgi:hypothetical protein
LLIASNEARHFHIPTSCTAQSEKAPNAHEDAARFPTRPISRIYQTFSGGFLCRSIAAQFFAFFQRLSFSAQWLQHRRKAATPA